MASQTTRMAILLLGVWLLGCTQQNQPPATPVGSLWQNPPAQPTYSSPSPSPSASTIAPASMPAGEAGDPADVIAVINGIPLSRSSFVTALIDGHGLNLLKQEILLIAARQKASQMNLTVTQAEIEQAHAEALQRLGTPIAEPDASPIDAKNAEKLLQDLLIAKNISRGEWNRRMEQLAYLHKIAAAQMADTPITPDMRREQYARQYGERVQIRHIQLSSLQSIQQARSALAEGQNFELVARRMSENQFTSPSGGLLPPFTRQNNSIPPILRETAFNMSVGEVSAPIHDGTWHQIIKVERKFPASSVGFENVDQEKLKAAILDRLITQRQQELESELYEAARLNIRDAALRQQFNTQGR